MISTLNSSDQAKITAWLDTHPVLTEGIGDGQSTCSIGAINLALTGELIDDIPECMSKVIGEWIIQTQDEMPLEIRNSPEWRALLPLAAGTGREYEMERVAILTDHTWNVAFPLAQPFADAEGFGPEWAAMCREQAAETLIEATAHTAERVVNSAYLAAEAVDVATLNVATAAYATAAANVAFATTKVAAIDADHWLTLNPIGLLERLIHEVPNV